MIEVSAKLYGKSKLRQFWTTEKWIKADNKHINEKPVYSTEPDSEMAESMGEAPSSLSTEAYL